MDAPQGIIVNKSVANESLKNLSSLRWVCITSSSHCEYLANNGALFINRFIKLEDAFNKVADGTFDAFLGDYSVLSHELKSHPRAELKAISPIWLESQTLHIIFNKNKTILRNQVNSILPSISPTAIQLWEKSASEEYLASKAYSQFKRQFNKLNTKENNKELLTFSFVDGLFPINATNKVGDATGYLNDTLELLSARSGFQFKYIPVTNYQELERLFLANKVDLIPTMTPTKISDGVLIALPSYYSLEMVLISKRSSKTQRIGYLDFFSDPKLKLANNTNIDSVSFKSIPALFYALRNDNIDGVMLPQSIAAYQLNQFYIGEFHINPKYQYSQPVYFLANNDLSETVTLLENLFKTLTSNDFNHIVNHHGIFNIERGYDKQAVNTTVIVSLIILSVLVVCFVSWRLTINREIAKRKHAEQVALSKLNFTQKLIDDLPTMVIIQSPDQRRIMWNKAYKDNFAHLWDDKGEYLRNDLTAVKQLISQNKQSMDSGEVINQHISFTNKAGQELELFYTKKPYLGVDGQLAGIMTVITDVTEHSTVQRESQAVQQLLQTITDTIPGGVFQYEYYENGEGCYTYISKGAQSLLGVTSRQLNHRGMTGCISPCIDDEDRVRIARAFKSASCHNSMIDIEFKLNNLGQKVWCRYIANADSKGNKTHQGVRWNGLLLDISLLKNHNVESNANQLAHQAEVAKSRFIATMSHELRTPISGVNGFIELLKASSLDSEQSVLIEHLESSVVKLRSLVDDIFYYTHTSSGNIEIANENTDLESHLCRVLRAHEHLAVQKGLNFNLNWLTAAYSSASVDISHLLQVVSHVLSNAVKFTKTGTINCEVHFEKQSLNISVTDTGKGMTAEELAQIFKPFEQADNSIQRQYDGTGLGLTLAKQLIEAMQGEITLSSTYGKGTNVYLTIPLHNVKKAPLNATAYWLVCSKNSQLLYLLETMGIKHTLLDWSLEQSELFQADYIVIDEEYLLDLYGEQWRDKRNNFAAKFIIVTTLKGAQVLSDSHCYMLCINPLYPDALRELFDSIHTQSDLLVLTRPQLHGQILIAEDNKTNQLLLEKQCQKLGIKAVMVEDGLAALKALDEGQFDLLLTDCHMPHLDGFKLAEQIRANDKLKHLPIIGFTADDSKSCLSKALTSGMNSVLFKPYKLNELYNRLAEFIDLNNDSGEILKVNKSSSLQGVKDKQHWLNVFGNESDAKMLAKVFINSLQEDVITIEGYLTLGELDKISSAIHKLKGAIVMLQYPPISELIVETEKTFSDSHDIGIIDDLIYELKDIIAKISIWI